MLVGAQKAFAGVVDMNTAFFASLFNKVECATKLVVRELQFVVVGSASHREDGEYAPVFDTERDEVFLEVVEMRIAAGVDTSYNIPKQGFLGDEEFDGGFGTGETVVVLANPVVFRFKAVETYGDGVHARGE